MKNIAIIGGLSLMTAGTTSMIWNKNQLGMNPNTFAIASGSLFLSVGVAYRF